ncbi:hypothetical protein GJ700_20530 [Duganella sp. FT92W]|uniref:histidine kinase n=1 Tax=Pseudoduganella rivuli TaxID=2666085 RepID=A0A7X2LVN5_9BURK|nr:ATP-binding protein [Pseudoduganella rivuli]MRV74099.1 hypothetical protein [Pseudoduganella rivuli]
MAAMGDGGAVRWRAGRLLVRMLLWLAFIMVAGVVTLEAVSLQSYREGFYGLLVSDQNTLLEYIARDLDKNIGQLSAALSATALTVTPSAVADRASARRFLSANAGLRTLFDRSVSLQTPAGKLLESFPALPANEAVLPWPPDALQQLVRSGKPLISEPYLPSQSQRRVMVSMAAPVFAADRSLLAIHGGSVALADLGMLSSFCRTVIGKTGYLFLVTRDGRLIQHPDRSRLLERAFPYGSNAVFERALQGKDGAGVVTMPDGERYIASFKRVAATGWVVASILPEKEAFADFDKLVGQLLLVMSGVCAAVMVLVSFLTRHLLGRLASANLRLQRLRGQALRKLHRRSQFFQEASHDFKQRLHALQLLLQIGSAGDVAGMQSHLPKAATVINSLKAYVGDFLEFAQLESTGVRPATRTVALQDVFQQLDFMFEEMVRERSVALKIRFTPVVLMTDERLLLRMLENLLSNAVKFGRGKILLGVRRRGNGWCIEIWDNGPGIPAADKIRVFEAFDRSGTAACTDGVGLGLAIVKRLAAALGYRVELHSLPGRHSCFRIFIPG